MKSISGYEVRGPLDSNRYRAAGAGRALELSAAHCRVWEGKGLAAEDSGQESRGGDAAGNGTRRAEDEAVERVLGDAAGYLIGERAGSVLSDHVIPFDCPATEVIRSHGIQLSTSIVYDLSWCRETGHWVYKCLQP